MPLQMDPTVSAPLPQVSNALRAELLPGFAPAELAAPRPGDALLEFRQGQLQPEEHHLNRLPQQRGGMGLPGRRSSLHGLAQLHELAHAYERASRAELRPGIAQRVADICCQNSVVNIKSVLDQALHDHALLRIFAILAAADAFQHLRDGSGGIFRSSTCLLLHFDATFPATSCSTTLRRGN